MPENLREALRALKHAPSRSEIEWAGFREIRETQTIRHVRDGKPEANATSVSHGVMVEVLSQGQFGYAATSRTDAESLLAALERARIQALQASRFAVHRFTVAQTTRRECGISLHSSTTHGKCFATRDQRDPHRDHAQTQAFTQDHPGCSVRRDFGDRNALREHQRLRCDAKLQDHVRGLRSDRARRRRRSKEDSPWFSRKDAPGWLGTLSDAPTFGKKSSA